MVAKCISLSNYNLSSTNVLIIGAGIGWHVLALPCVLSQASVQKAGCLCAVHLLSPLLCPSLCKGSDQRIFLSLVLHTDGPKVTCTSGLWGFVVPCHSPLQWVP